MKWITYVNNRILQYRPARRVDDRLNGSVAISHIFQIPTIPPLVVLKSRKVVAFVEILENARENFRFFIWQVDSLVRRLEELVTTCGLEERRMGKNIFVSSEETLFTTDAKSDYRTG